MTSYKGLLNKIEAFCNAHLQIKKYGGEFKEQMPNFSTEDEKYPIVYVVPTSDLSDLNTNQFTLDVYCVDIIQKDRANINTIVSDCNLIVNDLYLYFLDGNDLSIDVIGASSGSPINNFDLDYTAGWVKTITFEVNQYNVCAIPMSPINPNPPLVCDPANYNLIDTLDNILYSGSINSGATSNIVVQNSTVENSDASYSASILAEDSLVLPDIKIDVQNSALTVVNTATVASVQDVTINAPDGTINIKKTGDGTISSQSVPSGATVNYNVADNAITVNSGNGFSIDATDPLNIVLTDGTSSVTPTSVTYSQAHHKVDIVLPATPTPTPRSTATLMKTGQTISYGDYDDGYDEYGREVDFFTLTSAPIHNNGAATLNTTTNRFTDTLGGQTYTNNIVLDWSTWNGSTLIGYYRVVGASMNWTTARAHYPTLTISGFTNWRLPNINQMKNLQYFGTGATRWNDYTPMNIAGAGGSFWCNTTSPSNSNLSFYFNGFNVINEVKAASLVSIGCRTFSLSTSNVLS